MLFRFTGKGGCHLYWLLGEPSPNIPGGAAPALLLDAAASVPGMENRP